MERNQRSRILILAMALLLLSVGATLWSKHQQEKEADFPETISAGVANKGKPAIPDGSPGSKSAQTDQSKLASNPATNSNVREPVQAPVTQTPGNQKPPEAQTAAVPPAQPAPANQTAAVPPAQPAPAKAPATQIAAVPPAPAKAPATQTAVVPPAPAKAPATQTAAVSPAPAKTPATQTAAVPPAQPAPAKTTATQTAAVPPAQPAPADQEIRSTVTLPGNRYPSTKRENAIAFSKQTAGRENPCLDDAQRVPYPNPWTKLGKTPGTRTTSDDELEELEKDRKEKERKGKADPSKIALVPPPPPTTPTIPAKPTKKETEKALAPPPPPENDIALPTQDLPQPPDIPLVSPRLRLAAIVDKKAVLLVPLGLRVQNKWPPTICLGAGEKFEDPEHGSFTVVSVERDSVTIEEEQERSVKSLSPIR